MGVQSSAEDLGIQIPTFALDVWIEPQDIQWMSFTIQMPDSIKGVGQYLSI